MCALSPSILSYITDSHTTLILLPRTVRTDSFQCHCLHPMPMGKKKELEIPVVHNVLYDLINEIQQNKDKF